MKRFDWKSFISFGLFFSFMVMSITGVVLYIAPPGRVARWVNWEFVKLPLDAWQALHTNFSYLFLILAVFHLFSINWQVFWSYVRKKAAYGIHRKRELAAGLLLFAVVLLGTLYKAPPLQTVMDVGGYFSDSWQAEDEKAPAPHTESMTIAEVSEKLLNLSPEEIIGKLEMTGIRNVERDQTLRQIGEESGKSPLEIYRIISR